MRSRIDIRRLFLAALCPLLAACSDFAGDFQAADERCVSAAEVAPRARCYQVAEREVWARDSPRTLLDFDVYSARRIQLAEAMDAGAITPERYTEEMALAQKSLADAQTRVYGADRPTPAEIAPPSLQSVLDAVSAAKAVQSRAEADAAVAKAMQLKDNPYPTIRNTTCKRNELVPSQVECKATNP